MSAPTAYPSLELHDDDLVLTAETVTFLKNALGQDLTEEEITKILFEARTSYVIRVFLRNIHLVNFTFVMTVHSEQILRLSSEYYFETNWK